MRLKLIAGNVIVVLLVGLGSYFVVRSQLQDGLSRALETRIDGDSELFARSWTAEGARLVESVSDRASSSQVRSVFNASGEQRRRGRAFSSAQSVSKWFQDPARGRRERPHIVALVDETGRVVARDTDPNRMVGQSLRSAVPAVKEVLETGSARDGVWLDQGKLVHVGVAAVRNDDGGVVGALLVGYDLSNGFAQQEAAVIGQDLLFVTGDTIYSTSTSVGVRDALQKALYSEPLDKGTQAALRGKRTTPWKATLRGEDYLGVTAPLPRVSGIEAGYVILASLGKSTALAEVAAMILWLTLLGIVAVGIYGFIIANNLMEPIARMEDDILAVINGRGDVRLEVEGPELGGLSYRINQLINLFTGVAEEDEEGRAVTSSGGWDAVNAGGSDVGSVGRPSVPIESNDPDVRALAALPEDQYFAELFATYVAAKQSAGEDVSNIPKDRFIERIRGNAAHLLEKHGAQMVRFKVETIGGQVSLQPVIIR
ncbi:MAG: MXAN_5187 C-terminal domain-containing protein [Myxococcota bacterium]